MRVGNRGQRTGVRDIRMVLGSSTWAGGRRNRSAAQEEAAGEPTGVGGDGLCGTGCRRGASTGGWWQCPAPRAHTNHAPPRDPPPPPGCSAVVRLLRVADPTRVLREFLHGVLLPRLAVAPGPADQPALHVASPPESTVLCRDLRRTGPRGGTKTAARVRHPTGVPSAGDIQTCRLACQYV